MALDGGLESAWQPGLYARGNAGQVTGVLLVSIPQGLLREQMGATPTEALRIQQALEFVGMVIGVLLLLQLLGHVLTFVFFIFVCFIFLCLSLFSLPFSVLAHHFLLYFVPHLPSFRSSYYSLKGVLGGVVASFCFILFCHWRHLDLAKANTFCKGPESTLFRLCECLCATAQLCHCRAKAAMANT